MSLPDQLQKQVDEANRIIEQHYGPDEAGVTGQQGGDSSADSESNVANADALQNQSVADGENAAPQVQEDENSQTYAQRWRSQQGIVASLNNQLAGATQRIQSLENVIAMMQSAPAAQPQENRQTEAYLTDKDREDYGDDMIDFATRAAKQENAELRAELAENRRLVQQMGQQLQQLQGQVVPTVQRVAQAQQRTAQQEFFGELTRLVPNWESTNGNQRFHEWLLSPDPLTGITRQTYLEDAQRSLDVGRVASIFKAFAPATGTTTATNRKAPASELEYQVAPGRTMAAPSPSANEARKWSRAEIAKFYDDNRRGSFRGREAEFKALEQDLFAAQKEGRIV